MRILRLDAVKAITGHRSHNSIYSAIRAGVFPRQIQIGPRSVGWPSDEVEAITTARVAGKTEEELRDLVTLLHSQRALALASLGGRHV